MLINQLHNTDFMKDALKYVDRESVDLICNDPPYFILHKEGIEWDSFPSEEAYLNWMTDLFNLSYALLKPNRYAWFFCSQWYFGRLERVIMERTDFKIQNRCIWNYTNTMAMFDKAGMKLTWEGLFFLLKGESRTWNREDYDGDNNKFFFDVKTYPLCKSTSVGPNKKVHPSQKPVELIKELVQIASYKDELVLDPTAGSGTTGVACKDSGRNYILFEREPTYIPMIQERLDGGSGEYASPLHAENAGQRAPEKQKGLF